MFSFLKSKKSTIQSISIPNFDWNMETENTALLVWINNEKTMGLSLNYFDLKPDLPTITDLDMIRDFYRTLVSQANGGLVEVDIIDLKGHAAVKTIFKFKQEPHGMAYLASLTIPFEKCSYVIKIQAPEFDMTGMRDSMILADFMREKKVKLGKNGLENWLQDPYDSDFKSTCLMNPSDLPVYDAEFPNHPLSQARKLLATIESDIEFKADIANNKKFIKYHF